MMPRSLLPLALSSSLRLSGLTLGACVFWAAAPAAAQDEETLREARATFQKALELEHAGNWGGALKLFRNVGQIKMTPQVRYHIATCEENLGQLVAALGGYELALAQAEGMHPDFISEVQSSIDDLRARIPKVVVERAEGSEAAQIKLDGVQLGESSLGSETPVDPGPHTVTASAPGFEDYQNTVSVAEGSVEVISVTLERKTKDTDRGDTGGVVTPPDSGTPDFGPWPYVAGGVGVGGLILGGSLLGVALGKFGKQKDLCGGDSVDNCPESEKDEVDKLGRQANGFEAGGWIGIGVGVVGIGAGVAMLVMGSGAKEESPESGHLQVRPYALGSDAGLSLSGSF